MCIYMYIHICSFVYWSLYVYTMYIHIHVYKHIYIYIYTPEV